MTRKDYIKIAKVLSTIKPDPDECEFYTFGIWEDMLVDFCMMLEDDNPNFNPHKFLDACNYED